MSPVFNIIIHVLANAAAIKIADRLLDGFNFRGDWFDLLIAAIFLGLVNSFVRPILKLLALPAIIITFGLFSLVINIAMLYLVAKILPTLTITSFWAALGGVIIISLVNHIIGHLAKKNS